MGNQYYEASGFQTIRGLFRITPISQAIAAGENIGGGNFDNMSKQ